MPKDPTRQQYSSGLTYVAQKPSFLQNFGKVPTSPPHQNGQSSNNREPLPSRPREGRWAKGSDNEEEDPGEEDEWEESYGGGEDGPQVVVLKQGRHLNADELKRERQRASGKNEDSPPQETMIKSQTEEHPQTRIQKARATVSTSSKRKLVGGEIHGEGEKDKDGDTVKGKRKKKKADKGLLSFDDA
ncbi:hypothetical protein TREMEDRAFT_70186 [Tremella mesenterica DSM 1558]|uniref:uncharacterized protein n=1 Tax=Tremella mesenterica (strain ATCC 24925 / CBS 8224 / DSM 1558 / NBRC 9311 / NRRL Y-6157 / RJB 2259-6 / UBC 559-6) TaxID=578456 RepID=UPI00032D280A|nr:uncharacterized protein TREMEDRAFT_70186 [Tremella mesenterica DSM 1558]EIW66258.1 hypothetical protein TREMEDRAFT_70186 [Tremella mesenterica DSM 1558]